MSCRGILAYPLICLALLATLATSAAAQVEQRLPEIRLPDGFKINVFARVPNARSMAVANELGLVFVGTRRGDKVYALLDRDRNGQAENVVVIYELLRAPNGIAWRDGYLYVAEQHQVSRYRVRNLPSLGRTEPEVIFRNLPNKSRPPVDTTKPVVEFNAHVAALGMHFYRGHQLPADYRTDAFVAQHGSWNRSTPIGYRVMRIRMDKTGKVLGQKVFADGWLQDGTAWGRPVDIKELWDGSLLVSDDRAGVIYRIRHER